VNSFGRGHAGFCAKGFVRATNKDIAQAAGNHAGLDLHYFTSKEDLLRVALEEPLAFAGHPLRSTADAELPPETLLRFIVRRGCVSLKTEFVTAHSRVFARGHS